MVVRLLEQGALDDGFAVLEVTLGEELHCLGNALRSLVQTLARSVLSKQLKNGLNVPCKLLSGLFVVFFYFPVCHGL